jgi:hypothetical protein
MAARARVQRLVTLPLNRQAKLSLARDERLAAGLLIGLVCAIYLSFIRSGFNSLVIEEAFFAQHAWRVYLGALPYRDFYVPYTPGIFYFYAWVMAWFGPDLLPLRVLQVVCRVVVCLALYAAGRAVMPPLFAAIAPALLLGMDPTPPYWDIHPGWYAAALTVLTVLAVTRYLQRGQAQWLVTAGVATGAGFALKQNTALFGLMAVLWLLAVAESRLAPLRLPRWLAWPGPRQRPPGDAALGSAAGSAGGRRLTATRLALAARVACQVAALVLLPLSAAALIRPYFSPLLFVFFVLPLVTVSATATRWVTFGTPAGAAPPGQAPPAPPGDGPVLGRVASFYARPLLVLGAFGAFTLPWAILLLRALDWRLDLLAGFVGHVDPTGYYLGMPPLEAWHVVLMGLLLLTPWGVSALVASRLWGFWGAAVGLSVVGSLAVALLCRQMEGHVAINPIAAALRALYLLRYLWESRPWPVGWAMLLYLPVLAFWPAQALLAGRLRRRGGEVGTADLLRLWYLAAGATLLLTQYPRMDESHLPWSVPILLVAGADVLYAWYRCLLRRTDRLRDSGAARVALGVSLVLLPTVAVSSITHMRSVYLYRLHNGLLAPLDLPRANVAVEEDDARAIRSVVAYLQARTAPGEPIFAYPVIPGFYYLADRPNPTRFNHLFAGMATPAEQEEILSQLEGVRYVVWDYPGAFYWVQPGDNARVTEYIRTSFRLERFLGQYAILSRDEAGAQFHYPLPDAVRQGGHG